MLDPAFITKQQKADVMQEQIQTHIPSQISHTLSGTDSEIMQLLGRGNQLFPRPLQLFPPRFIILNCNPIRRSICSKTRLRQLSLNKMRVEKFRIARNNFRQLEQSGCRRGGWLDRRHVESSTPCQGHVGKDPGDAMTDLAFRARVIPNRVSTRNESCKVKHKTNRSVGSEDSSSVSKKATNHSQLERQAPFRGNERLS